MQHVWRTARVAGCACAFACTPALAGNIAKEAIGTYELKGNYNQKVKIGSPNGGRSFVGSFEVATRGCQGDVRMDGRAVSGNDILFVKKDPNVEGGACKINVRFSSDFSTIDVSHSYCGYSGASCDFNGKLKRTKR